jgi:hypothetical protein
MATVEKLGGNWVIVRGHIADGPDRITGSPAAQETTSSPNREFWTGDGWAAQYGFARQFATKEEAETCLGQHCREMK